MRKMYVLLTFLVALCAVPAVASAGPANNPDHNFSRTFEFDPDKTGCAVANWSNGAGRADSQGKTNFGLVLQKNCDTSVVAAPGAVANGIKGTQAATVGFDISDDSPCTGGSPRFNLVDTAGGFHFVGGCGNDNERTSTGDGWTRVRFELNDGSETFPPVPPGLGIESLTLIADEEGQYRLDNISVDNRCAEKPGNSRPCS